MSASDPVEMWRTKMYAESMMREYDAMPRVHRDIDKEFSYSDPTADPTEMRKFFEDNLREVQERKLNEVL